MIVAFHVEVMVWPDASVKANRHPLIALLPLSVMVICSVSPVFHASTTSVILQAPAGPVGGAVVGGGDRDGGRGVPAAVVAPGRPCRAAVPG